MGKEWALELGKQKEWLIPCLHLTLTLSGLAFSLLGAGFSVDVRVNVNARKGLAYPYLFSCKSQVTGHNSWPQGRTGCTPYMKKAVILFSKKSSEFS